MKLLPSKEILLSAFLGTCLISVPIIVERLVLPRRYKKLKKMLASNRRDLEEDSYFHCIFFSGFNNGCRTHIFEANECSNTCSYSHLQTIINFISSAMSSISMCVYFLTLRQISDALLMAHERGVVVRIITDYKMYQIKKCKLIMLRDRFGVPVKHQSGMSENYMHHKFCLIDENKGMHARLLLGSLNMTLQGCTQNFEFVVLTNDPGVVQRYSNEFELLWKKF